MSKKMLRLLLVGLIVALGISLVACGGGAAPASAPAQDAAAPAEEAATEEPAAEAPSGEKRVFRLWYYEAEDSAQEASWADALKDFQAMHPDVTVEFERKTFEQMQQTAQMVLNSNDVPDVMEANKGNATAGLYSKQGLLTDLTQVAQERGWDKIMSPSIQTTCRYNEKGIMGDGPLYGVTTYGEFVMVYYNKDMFEEHGVTVPTTLEEFEAVADKFVAAGIVPIALGGQDSWTITHNWQELVLYKADRELINNFQLLTGEVDFQGEAFTFGSEKLAEHVQKGYYGDNATGVSDSDANGAFVQGKHPMRITGSWAFGGLLTQVKDFEWGIFLMPGKKFTTGSGGNLWVVPQNAKNKDLAYDFIDLTMQKKSQTVMANAGGIPINADLNQITDEKSKELNTAFNTIVQNDGLAFYPDWPAPGYMDTLGSGLQELLSGTKTPAEFNESIAGPYNDYKASLQ